MKCVLTHISLVPREVRRSAQRRGPHKTKALRREAASSKAARHCKREIGETTYTDVRLPSKDWDASTPSRDDDGLVLAQGGHCLLVQV